MEYRPQISVSIARLHRRERAMAEKKVPYQVDGRPFEGMIVYDEA